MKTKTTLLTLALCFATAAACFASPMMGTWKLNAAKSKLGHGMARNNTVMYHSTFFKVKATIDGVDAKGKPTHNEWTGNFDGKDYPVTGDPKSDMRSYKKVDDHTMDFTIKKGGKVTMTGRIVISADGKSRTVNETETTAKGKKMHVMAVYDKQ